MSGITIRPVTSEDVPFLQEMLYAALFWRPDGERLPVDVALAHPQVVIFHEAWGRQGDGGFVAEAGGERIGAAWYRLFTDASHGEGFVDEDTPELAIAVVEGHRGQGVGRMLIEATHDLARRAGIGRVSLSVNADNPAKSLYRAIGYREYVDDPDDERMMIDL